MTRLRPAGALFVVVAAGACRGGPPVAAPEAAPAPPPADTGEAACLVARATEAAPDTLRVGLSEPVDPAHAPVPTNAAEALVFRHLYETLIHVNCAGGLAPGLATAWRTPDGGRTWLFTLGGGARFWDGAPVTARDVVAGWSASTATKGGALTASVEAPDVVRVTLRQPETVPRSVADPSLAVIKPAPAGGWPIGAGAWWVTPTTAGAAGIAASPTTPARPVIDFRLLAGADLRDALDGGIDLVVTRDRATLAYAGTLPAVTSVALAWDRTYVLAVPPRGPGSDTQPGGALRGVDTTLWRAVRAEARTPPGPFWWQAVAPCRGGQSAAARVGTPTGPRRVVYDRSDVTARELANRLVALAAAGAWPGREWTGAAGLATPEFAVALQAGTEAAYVIALPRNALDPCGAARAGLPDYPARLTPLVDTRRRALVRSRTSVVLDWDGTPHIAWR